MKINIQLIARSLIWIKQLIYWSLLLCTFFGFGLAVTHLLLDYFTVEFLIPFSVGVCGLSIFRAGETKYRIHIILAIVIVLLVLVLFIMFHVFKQAEFLVVAFIAALFNIGFFFTNKV